MTTENYLDNLFPQVSVWTSDKGGFKRYKDLKHLDNNQYDVISDSQLAAVDPRLPQAIRLMEKDYETLFGLFVRRMLQVWNVQMRVESTDGRKVCLYSIKDVELKKKYVRFTASSWVYKEVVDPKSNESYLMPEDGATKITTVHREWMDATYPGWDKRFMIAETLGLERGLAIATMFSEPVFEQTIALPVDMAI